MPSKSLPQGFTLIELLVVITIIAVLSALGFIAYSGFLKNSRDARRQSDMKIIQSALEEYYADQIYYPVSLGISLTSGAKTYLNTIPTDPKGGTYTYTPTPSNCSGSSCSSYCLYATFEGTNIPASDQGCTPVSLPYNYGVTRP